MRALYVLLVSLYGLASSALALTPNLPNDGGDATPAFNQAVSTLCNSANDRQLILTAGVFSFLTPPAPIPCAVTIIGQGKGATRLIRRYSGGGFLVWTRGVDQAGGGIRNTQVEAGVNTTNGIAILVQALPDTDPNTNSLNRHSFEIDNVIVGREHASASWYVGVYFDGSQNPENDAGIAPGIRAPFVTRTTISGYLQSAIYLNKTKNALLEVDCYIPLQGAGPVIYMGNVTVGTVIETRSCVPTWVDNASNFLLWNWQRYR